MIDRIKGIINVEWEKIKPIQPDDVKINTNINALKKSLKNHGFSLPFAVWKDDNVIYCVDGHTRVKALKELKHEGEDVPDKLKAFEIEANDRKEAVKILVEVFNQKHNQFDNEVLINWLEVEQVDIQDLEAVNLSSPIIEKSEAQEDDFEIPDEIKTDIKLGDLIEIGKHRLLCGDSTDSDAVAKLMNGEKADITFTSPPYNAGDNSLGGNKNKVDNKYETYDDKKDQSDWKQFVSDVLKNCLINSENVFYNIQQLAGNKIGFIELLYEYRNQFVDEIFWIKGHGQPAAAKNVLNSRVEHILIYRNEDKPKRTITTGDFHGTLSNYYEGNGNSKNEFSKIHAATFPIHLPEYVITNYSQKSVLDVFLGTGTTMVAAHQLKRKCYGMELDPKYCQVIIDRMLNSYPDIEVKINGQVQ